MIKLKKRFEKQSDVWLRAHADSRVGEASEFSEPAICNIKSPALRAGQRVGNTMGHQCSSAEFRMLSVEETEAVGGGDYSYRNGDKVVTEHFDSNGFWTGATYQYDSGGGHTINSFGQTTSSWSGNSFSAYSSVGVGAFGFTGGVSHVWGGDTYVYGGFGTPGPSASSGFDADGDLSGPSLNLPAGVTGLVVDPTTGAVTAVEAGKLSPSLTYSVSLNEVYRSLYGHVENFTEGFIREYLPEPMWNPQWQPEPQQ